MKTSRSCMVQCSAFIGKLALKHAVTASVHVDAAIPCISSNSICFALECIGILEVGALAARAIVCVSLLLRLNKWKEITLKKRRQR